nr:sulfatase/phosphatase domain-containing protein [Kiritimatiella glycovorans]
MKRALDRLRRPPEFELYDLEEDPGEFVNLADDPKYAGLLERMKHELRAWQEETDDPLRKPENLALMTEWHRELLADKTPVRGHKPKYAVAELVMPEYRAMVKRLR